MKARIRLGSTGRWTNVRLETCSGTVYAAWSDCRFRPGCSADDVVCAAARPETAVGPRGVDRAGAGLQPDVRPAPGRAEADAGFHPAYGDRRPLRQGLRRVV